MTNAIKMIIDFIRDVYSTVDNALVFELFGTEVKLFSFVLSVVVLVMVCSVFWKGVKG